LGSDFLSCFLLCFLGLLFGLKKFGFLCIAHGTAFDRFLNRLNSVVLRIFRQLLRVFVEVVRQGGFSRAAKTVFATQSTVSKAVKQLEDEIGVPLLDRIGHRSSQPLARSSTSGLSASSRSGTIS
jgi:hypothetical protein